MTTKKLNIFTDFHHSGLYNSFHLLFEKRLGHNLYRPIGREWFTNGFWKIAEPYNNDEGTIGQFLNANSIPTDGTRALNNIDRFEDGIYYIHDDAEHCTHKAITFDKFKEMDIDIVIASIPDHIATYKKLIKQFKPNAKLIFHIGNIGWDSIFDIYHADNIMASVSPMQVDPSRNIVFYRQEFDLEVFKPSDNHPQELITSFVHNANDDKSIFTKLSKMLPHIEFSDKAYTVRGTENIASTMNNSLFGYHNKPGGDGFGHIIHNWMAVGRPVLVNLKDYRSKLAGDLLIDLGTCVDVSERPLDEVAKLIEYYRINKLEYSHMCRRVQKIFKEHVNFEQDAIKVSEFLDKLI